MNQIYSSTKDLQNSVSYSIVIPVYGSASTLHELHKRLTDTMKALGGSYEIIFVDDCGLDNTWHVLKDLVEKDAAVIAIQLMRNAGQSNATLCGLDNARGELILTMDDDLQHPPEEIPRLLEAMTDEIDVVIGVPTEKNHNWFRRIGSILINNLNSYFLKKDPHLRFTSFRLMKKNVVTALLEHKTLYPVLGPMINSVTQRIVNKNVQHSKRIKGSTSYTFRKLASLFVSNLIGYSMLPLRFLAIIGFIGIILSLTFSIFLIVRFLTGGILVPGWTTIALLLLLISGFNFFAFAVIGEYVLRILQRVNHSPQYIVRKRINKKIK